MSLLSSRSAGLSGARTAMLVEAVLLAITVSACGGQPVSSRTEPPGMKRVPSASQASSLSVAERAASVAAQQVGVPYRYGGRTPRGFDCSGLVQYAYASAGKRLPRTTAELWRKMRPVSGGDLEVGDVLFFDIEGKVAHVGLYLGRGRFVHAPASGRRVAVEDLDSEFYRHALVRGGRP